MAQGLRGRWRGVIALVVMVSVVTMRMRTMDARERSISMETEEFMGAEMHLIDINYHDPDYRERAIREILN